MAASIPICNMVAHSRLAWLSALAAPDDEVLKAEDHGTQLLTRGPWHKLPFKLLSDVSLPLPHRIKSIEITSLAARTRTALRTSKVFTGLCNEYRTWPVLDESVFDPWHRIWIFETSIFAGWVNATDTAMQLLPDLGLIASSRRNYTHAFTRLSKERRASSMCKVSFITGIAATLSTSKLPMRLDGLSAFSMIVPRSRLTSRLRC